MFIPPGEPIHESLATSYVLVSALVADLCEGGFSGFVEVVLRDTDSFIFISNGVVAAGVEKRSDGLSNNGATNAYTRTTVEQIAERSRLERGRLSIFGYPPATAGAVAGRINAQPLYVGLSTEFTDLEKMISKLLREQEREWFIEVNTEGPCALIHMRDYQCRVFTSAGRADSGALDLASNPALGRLIYESNQAGGTFDVYFTQESAETVDVLGKTNVQRAPVSEPLVAKLNGEPREAEHEIGEEPPVAQNDEPVGPRPEPLQMVVESLDMPTVESAIPEVSEAAPSIAGVQSRVAPSTEPELPSLSLEAIEPKTAGLSLVRDELSPDDADLDPMTDVKRLMGEIARVIEDAAKAVGRADGFSMALRAGQIEVANRFPFLDPFAGEFEYLSGEIVFVGQTSAEEFVEGLTEALRLSIDGVTRSTAYADRFRSYVIEDLRKLQTRERAEFEKFALEEIIPRLITF
jgi:hypothetical protein